MADGGAGSNIVTDEGNYLVGAVLWCTFQNCYTSVTIMPCLLSLGFTLFRGINFHWPVYNIYAAPCCATIRQRTCQLSPLGFPSLGQLPRLTGVLPSIPPVTCGREAVFLILFSASVTVTEFSLGTRSSVKNYTSQTPLHWGVAVDKVRPMGCEWKPGGRFLMVTWEVSAFPCFSSSGLNVDVAVSGTQMGAKSKDGRTIRKSSWVSDIMAAVQPHIV